MNTQISTTTFDREKRYSGVYQQQGRMLRDADWNELVDVVKDRLATALQNVVGSGVPAIGGLFSTHGPQAGRAYVDGIEAELVVVPPTAGAPDPYADQADFPGAPALPAEYVLYLDVWERVVSALDDTGLVDPALHGADTCTRTQVLTQLKWCPPPAAGAIPMCEDPAQNPPSGDATLTASLRTGAGAATADPCDPCADAIDVTAPIGNYLFRIEVHSVEGPPNKPTNVVLKWSSENGAEQHPIGSTPADFGGTSYIYEQVDETTERQLGVHLSTGFSPTRGTLTTTLATTGTGFVRRWDGVVSLAIDATGTASLDAAATPASIDAGIPLTLAGSLDSHGNVTLGSNLSMALASLQVSLPLDSTFVPGDYWLALVREAAPDVFIPNPQPYGIRHHYLTLGQTAAGGAFTVAGSAQEFAFPTLTDISAGDIGYSNPGCASGIFSSATNVGQALDAVCDLTASQVSYSATANTTTASATNVQKAIDLLSVLSAAEIPYDPGTCAVLQGATNIEQALTLLCQNASQGNSFNFALIRLFGRGVICGVIPSIAVSAPAAGSTDVPITISVTNGTIIDGNGAVTVVTGVAPLQTTVPALVHQGFILGATPPAGLSTAIQTELSNRNLSGLVTPSQVDSLATVLAGKTFTTDSDLTRAISGAINLTNPDLVTAVTSGLATIAPPNTIVPAEVTQFLFIVTAAGQPPVLQLSATAPTSLMTLPSDVSDAIRNPSAGPAIPTGADCATAATDAWAAYGDVPCVSTNGNTNVCLGTVGVFGQAGWVSPDNREQITPPSVVAAWWRSQRRSTYSAQKAACIASSLTIASLNLGSASGPPLESQSLLGGTSSRLLWVTLSDIVRGTTPVTVVFQASAGVVVHGPLTVQPGQVGGSVKFDLPDAAGSQSITAQIDSTHQIPASFSTVQLETPAAPGGLLPGDTAQIELALSGSVTETLTVTLTSPVLTPSTTVIQVPPGQSSGSMTITVPNSAFSFEISAMGVTRTAQFAVTSMVSMNLPSGANLNGAVIAVGTQQSAVVTLSAPSPRPITIAVSSAGGVAVTPPTVSIPAGATTSQPFGIIPIIASFGVSSSQIEATFQTQQISAIVNVQGIGGFGVAQPVNPITPVQPISPVNPILGHDPVINDPGPVEPPPAEPE